MLVRSSSICPFVSAVSEETHEKASGLDCADSMLHGPNGGSGGHATDNETTQASICTDTIPLLCASNPSIINTTAGGGLMPTPLLVRKCSTGSDLDQQTLNFISSNNLKNTWESSVDISGHQHVNASDCISTISN